MPREELPTIETDAAAILARLAERQSCRRFDGTAMDRSLVEAILRDGTEAPSSCNHQNWHFVVIDERPLLAAACEIAGGNPHFAECSVLIYLCFRKGWTHDKFSIAQSVAGACYHMMLSAHLRGFAAIWNAGIGDTRRIAERFGIPPEVEIQGALCIGRPLADAPRMKAPRRPLAEVVSWNGYARPHHASWPLKPAPEYPFFAIRNTDHPYAEWRPEAWGWDRIADFRGLAVWAKSPTPGVYVPTSQGGMLEREVAALPELPDGATLVEVMPWGGTYSAALARRFGAGVRLRLAELSARNLGFVRERLAQEGLPLGSVEFDLMEAARLPYADASIDAVFLPQVLEQVPEPGALMDEVARVLRPGGCAVVSVRNLHSDWGREWRRRISREQVPNQGPYVPMPATAARRLVAERLRIEEEYGLGREASHDAARVDGRERLGARVWLARARKRP